MTHITNIYGLVDPRYPDWVMYVGKGSSGRAESHWRRFLCRGCSNSKMRRWFEKLRADGVKPTWKFLEENIVDWQTAEKAWIFFWRLFNKGLCNASCGGECPPLNPELQREWGRLGGIALRGNLSKEARLKMSLAKKGKPSPRKGAIISDETRAKQSVARKGRKFGPHSNETKAKLSASNRGKKHNVSEAGMEIIRQKTGDFHRGRKRSEETKLRMSAGKHQRFHVARNVAKPTCKLCNEELAMVAYG